MQDFLNTLNFHQAVISVTQIKNTLCLDIFKETFNLDIWMLKCMYPHLVFPLCVIMYLWVKPAVLFIFVGLTCICICSSYLVFVFIGYTLYLCLYICGSYLCLELERFIPSRFPSSPHLLRVHVVEGNDVSANIVGKWILVVRLLLEWKRQLSTC